MFFFSQTKNEMSAQHAGTRKWQKIINHEKKDSTVVNNNNLYNDFNLLSANLSNDFNTSTTTSNNIQNSSLYQPKKVENTTTAAAPITHPLFGVDPNQNQNGYMDPNAHYQQSGMPPPTSQTGLPPQANILNPQQPPMMAGGSYYNPANQMQNNNLPQQPMNFQTSAIPSQQQQQQQQQIPAWQNQPTQPGMMGGYQEQATQPQTHRQPEPPKEKPPLPEEYIYLQTVLEELKTNCLNAANDPRTKRKFVDVNKRLENLYDCLRDGRLNPATIEALNQIIQFLQIGDYGNALQVHTQIAFGSDFSQCAGFMPGLKVLIQSANELQVYLR
ncbi:hypothetical protein FF38_04464 [Lucilia cuprina]|uniref:Protein transport protein Sec31A n=1 Tax=Lucilia cuprina TaxID=7375 RepID=A0A0L0CFG6_LUCCU|nr:hypothetical protein FF38_04464 [Lucilia cuprina]